MKKILPVVLFTIISIFAFFPVKTYASVYTDTISFAATPKVTSSSDVNGLLDNYNKDQTCTGNDSILGSPSDPNSVAWLLNKVLTYVTIIGMVLVVVLSSIDFLKVIVKSDDEAMAKATKKLALRLVFAALLFFVPTLTNAILDIFGLTSESTCGIQQ